ncbi:MAG: MerR family transcriptional regulator [Myxococcota bacterium]
MSIGAVSRATGIPVETLRTWERRYGYPQPERTDGRHRVYRDSTVEVLNLVVKALAIGHRPSRILGRDKDTIQRLLDAHQEEVAKPEPAPPPVENRDIFYLPAEATQEPIVSWLEAIAQMNGEQLEAGFRSEWAQLGALQFLTRRLHPFLMAIGNAWARGDISVSHEHFASERIRDFLTTMWRPLSDRGGGPTVVLSCLPGEMHVIGLHIVATLTALGGCRIIFLGANVPLQDISETAFQCNARAVLVSISRAANTERVVQNLRELQRTLASEDVELVVGGIGAPRNMQGITIMTDLTRVQDWTNSLIQRAAS